MLRPQRGKIGYFQPVQGKKKKDKIGGCVSNTPPIYPFYKGYKKYKGKTPL